MNLLNTLDIRTLFLSSTLINLVLTFILYLLWKIHRERFNGILFWVTGTFSLALGNGLIGLRGYLPDTLTIVAGNTLLLLALALLYSGITFFQNKKNEKLRYIPYLNVLITALLFIYYGLIEVNLTARILIITITILINLLLSVYQLMKYKSVRDIPIFLSSGSMLIVILIMAVRIPLSLNIMPETSFMRSGWAQSMTVLIWTIGIIGWTVGFFLMISHELQDQEKQLAADREMLVREVHHRVKNNLVTIQSLLNLQIFETDEKSARVTLQESKNRVEAISMIHEMLSVGNNFKEMKLDEYLSTLGSSILNTYNLPGITLDMDLESVHIDINKMIPCGLIVTELITNACKYAFPEHEEGTISIMLKTENTSGQGQTVLTLTVKDDGVGLPEDFNTETNDSLGITIIMSLIKQLKGSLKVDRASGTRYEIRFRL